MKRILSKNVNEIIRLDLSQINKRINGILAMQPNDVTENELNMTCQFEKGRRSGSWRLETTILTLKPISFQEE